MACRSDGGAIEGPGRPLDGEIVPNAKGRVLGIDYGARRIGLAISDETRSLASPLCVIPGGPKAFETIARIVREQGVTEVVVGLPRTLAGGLGPEARRAMEFAERLGRQLPVPVRQWDERLTTLEASRRLAELKRRKVPVDAAAAAVMLQSYLEATRER